ncbi:hypothetical protein Scep_004631 [Stephania cephalantha]|uniref:Uncharacterized protein n=1 Tax=Stephania cephalantha TaxID=152367 RepID=A0AAP0KUJ8_9MAGN
MPRQRFSLQQLPSVGLSDPQARHSLVLDQSRVATPAVSILSSNQNPPRGVSQHILHHHFFSSHSCSSISSGCATAPSPRNSHYFVRFFSASRAPRVAHSPHHNVISSGLHQSENATSALQQEMNQCGSDTSRFAKLLDTILIPHTIVSIIHSMRIITILAMHRHSPIFGLMSNPQVPQHEGNQHFHQSTSLEDMMKQSIDNQQKVNQILEKIQQIDFEIPGLKDLETQFIQYNARLQNMTYEEKLCSIQPIFNPEEDVSVDTLKNFELNEVTQVEDYWRETSKECEVFQIEPESVIALNEGENEMKIDVISDKPEKPQIESEEYQPLVLVQPPTLPCTFGTPYKGVKVRERSQILYTADTFVVDDPDATDSFVLEVPNELLNLKEGVHVSLPNYVDASFVVDISKGEGTT